MARISKLDVVVNEIINKMPLDLDYRTFDLYKRGIQEGVKEGEKKERNRSVEAMMKLVSEGLVSIEKAAEALGISVAEMNHRIDEIKKDSGLK